MVNVLSDVEKHHPDYQGRIVPAIVDTDVKNRPFLGPRQFILINSQLVSSLNVHALYIRDEKTLCVTSSATRLANWRAWAKGDPGSTPQPPAHHLRLHENNSLCMHRGWPPRYVDDSYDPGGAMALWCMWTCRKCYLHLDDSGEVYLSNGTWRENLAFGQPRGWSLPGFGPRWKRFTTPPGKDATASESGERCWMPTNLAYNGLGPKAFA